MESLVKYNIAMENKKDTKASEVAELLSLINSVPKTKRECLLVFAALNRLNALVKQKEYEGLIKYWQIKPKVYELIKSLLDNGGKSFFDAIYYDSEEKCVYIIIYGLQFCFHNVSFEGLTFEQKTYITNTPQTWEHFRLQLASKIIYDKAKSLQESSISDDSILNNMLELKKEIPNG